jgi:hypothetical protein
MIANPSVTATVEALIWLTPTDIAAIKERHGIRPFPEGTTPPPPPRPFDLR